MTTTIPLDTLSNYTLSLGGTLALVDYTLGSQYYYTSTNLTSWTQRTWPFFSTPTASVVFGATAYAYANSGVGYYTSTDLINWSGPTPYPATAPGFPVIATTAGAFNPFRSGSSYFVIASSNGTNFSAAALTNLPYSTGYSYVFVGFGSKLYALPSDTNPTLGAARFVYSSSDGVTWTPTSALPWGVALKSFSAASFNGKIYTAGGVTASGAKTNAVYSSLDGASWSLETFSPAFAIRSQAELTSVGTSLIVAGGFNQVGGNLYDIWRANFGLVQVSL